MKSRIKIYLISLILIFLPICASAQSFGGLTFDIRYSNDTHTSNKNDDIYVFITPNFAYRVMPNLEVGTQAGFIYAIGTEIFGDYNNQNNNNQLIYTSIGWDLTPFARYKLLSFVDDKISIWADAHAYVGMDFPLRVESATGTTVTNIGIKNQVNYGFQITPMLRFKIADNFRLDIHFSIASIGYEGSTRFYSDGSQDFKNDLVLFIGKLSGLVNSASMRGLYGIKIGFGRYF